MKFAFAAAIAGLTLGVVALPMQETGEGPGGICFGGCGPGVIKREPDPEPELVVIQEREVETGEGPGGICFGGCGPGVIKREPDPEPELVVIQEREVETGEGPGGICFGGCGPGVIKREGGAVAHDGQTVAVSSSKLISFVETVWKI